MDKSIYNNSNYRRGDRSVRRVKNWILLMIMVILVGILVNLGGGLVTETYKKPNKIVFIPKSIDPKNDFWQTMKMGVELAAKEEDIQLEFVGPMAEKDIEDQAKILEEYVEDQESIILFSATHMTQLTHIVKKAKENKVSLVAVDSTVKGINNLDLIATDNVAAAGLLAQYLAELIGKEGEVIMLSFIEGTSTSKDRQLGYEEEIKKYPDIKMRPTLFTEGTADSSYEATLKTLEKYPNITGIVGGNQQTTEGVCIAIEEMGLVGQVKIVGFDNSETIVYGIEKSILDAVVVQKPFNMGYLAVKNALDLYRGKEIPSFTDTGYQLINKESLYIIENQKLLYPIIR